MFSRTLASRALLLRSFKNAADNVKQAKRNAGHGQWCYRVSPPIPKGKIIMLAEGFGAFAWWWIFWHIFTEYEHVTGEWPAVTPSEWTDAELGIPPDSAGPLK